jgi:hypothetical protein
MTSTERHLSITVPAAILLAEMVAGETQTPAKDLPIEVAGVTVTPHVRAESLRYIRNPGKAEGALVRLFVRNTNPPGGAAAQVNEVRFNNDYPLRLIMDGQWSWSDAPNQWPERDLAIPAGAMTVWTFNGTRPPWAPGNRITLRLEDWRAEAPEQMEVELPLQKVWLSAVTFLSTSGSVRPDTLIYHIDNQSGGAVKIIEARLHLPKSGATYRMLYPQPPLKDLKTFPADGVIPAGDKGGARVSTGPLPLTYTVLEVTLTDASGKAFSIWARVRIKREAFDISGGWIGGATKDGSSALTHEVFLKTLKRVHVNTGHIGLTPGYTDQTGPNGLYTRYPIKFFGGLRPLEVWDTNAMLPRIHAVECLGEPQFGGGAGQRLPQEVFRTLEPYAPTRLPTTVTLSDESNWRYYAGLSDYPHYDAYRVTAPSADFWPLYDRWGGPRIAWGAPLETIGDMCRSLRKMGRPAPTAYWSQGPASGWEVYGGRRRLAPTPDEIRLQAYHALASRITSLYWFNLSLSAFVQFRDTIDELTRIGREMRMLEEFYLEGDAYRYRQVRRDGRPDWDLASIAAPRGALLFTLDLDYAADLKEKVFKFGLPRKASFAFDLPAYLRKPADVFRVDAHGVYNVAHRITDRGVEISDRQTKVAIYVATPDRDLRSRIEKRRQMLLAEEASLNFDPARNDADFDTLKALAKSE